MKDGGVDEAREQVMLGGVEKRRGEETKMMVSQAAQLCGQPVNHFL